MDASMRQKDAQTEKNFLASAFPNQFFSPPQNQMEILLWPGKWGPPVEMSPVSLDKQ